MTNRGKAQAQTIIAAVSGGVDSAVMLYLLASRSDLYVVVAHFDHGMREDSAADARFAEGLAGQYNLQFELGRGRLGPNASEDEARQARHNFLRAVSQKYPGAKITTAHHRDDVIETAIINILRGTGRRGLSSLRETDLYRRPLLDWTKSKIYGYAAEHRLEWVEDATNVSDKYLRNRIRHKLIPLLRQRGDLPHLEEIINWFYKNNVVIGDLVEQVLASNTEATRDHLALSLRILTEQVVNREILVATLTKLGVKVDKAEIHRLLTFVKTSREGMVFNQFPPLRITRRSTWLLFEKQTAFLQS